jgi:hypothetical protein
VSCHPECGHTSVFPPPPRAKDSKQTSFSHNKHTTATCTRAIRRGLSAHILWTSRPSIPLSSHKWGRIPHAKYSRSNAWELTRARMVMLPQVEEEDSVCGMFWRSDARISNRQIRRSATYLFMFLDRHQSLKAFKTTKVLKPLISPHGRRHLKWCQHLSPRGHRVFQWSITRSLSRTDNMPPTPLPSCKRTTLEGGGNNTTSLPDAVAARASLLGHPRYVVPC